MTTPNIEELIERLRDAQTRGTTGEWFDRAEAADALQSQAERIKTLEGQSIEVDKVLARENVSLRATLKQCESRLHDVATLCATVEIERDTLRAQLEQIAATEPVGVMRDSYTGMGDTTRTTPSWTKTTPPAGTKLFTRPMPAQDVTELAEALERIEDHRTYDMHWASEVARIALSKYKEGAK